MSFIFSRGSQERLHTCHFKLQRAAKDALTVSPVDFTIVHGHRDEESQNRLYDKGASKLLYPSSKHNATDQRNRPQSIGYRLCSCS